MNVDGKSKVTGQEIEPVKAACHTIGAVLKMIEKNLPEGSVRIITPVLRDESGEVVLSCVTWMTPGANEASEV
jgi:hypothetical protein